MYVVNVRFIIIGFMYDTLLPILTLYYKSKGETMETIEIYKSIGKIIRNERNKRGLTLEQLAEKTQRDWSYLSQIERGKNVPSIETLIRICEALNISLGNLFAFHKPIVTYKADPYINKISNIIKERNVEDKKVAFNILSQVFKKKSKTNK